MAVCTVMAVFVWQQCKSWRFCNHAFLLACSLALLFFGLWRYSLSEIRLAQFSLRNYYEQKVDLNGRIVDEPRTADGKVQFELAEASVKNTQLTGRALVTIYRSSETLGYGDQVRLRCRLEAPQPIEDFRYDRFLAKDDIVALCRQAEVVEAAKFRPVWRQAPVESLMSRLLEFKSGRRDQLLSALPADEGSLLAGIMLGDGYLMSRELKEAYSRSGLSHIVAISGMNMTMIAVFLLFILVRLGLWRREASLVSIALIWAYALAIGLPSSAVRASIMSSLLLIAYLLGRLARAERLLLLTALAMLFVNPRLLRDDVGFQLSFLAFAGLLAYYEPIKGYLGRYFKHQYLAIPLEVISLTLAAQVLAWPILALNFGQISWVAPLSNLLVLWALGPMMILAFVGLLSASVLPPVWALSPALLLAKYQNAVARIIGGWPQSVIDAQGWSVYLFILYYCGIMLITLRTKPVSHDQNSACQNR
jgi:competence protein ComEC